MNTQDIGSYIREKRERNGWTQEGLAEMIGVSGKTVSTWEKGDGKSIKFENLEKLAKVFNVSLGEIQMGKDIAGISDEDRRKLDQVIRELNERIDDMHKITIKIEEHTNAVEYRGLVTIELGFYAFGIAVMALFLAMWAFSKNSTNAIICCVMWVLSIVYMIFGRQWVNKFERKRQAENDDK